MKPPLRIAGILAMGLAACDAPLTLAEGPGGPEPLEPPTFVRDAGAERPPEALEAGAGEEGGWVGPSSDPDGSAGPSGAAKDADAGDSSEKDR